ncbi:MAG TPA: hypothetical protein VFK45_04775 [Gammaproteobacteria bacterium]|nr:hypothetical protein [Gammaproteobacteria bacterium]
MTRQIIKLLIAAVLLVYPLAIYFADSVLTPSQLLAGLLVLLAARALAAAWITRRRTVQQTALAGVLLMGAILALAAFPHIHMDWLRFYPMLFNLLAFAMFFGSLFTDRPLVERFARLMNKDLPPQGVVYTRYVTWAWSGLLLLVALVSFYTAVDASFQFWSLFNGLIVYGVIAVAFGCEYMMRRHLRRRWEAA